IGFAFFDRRHQAVRLNPALAELCSRPLSELIGQRAEALLPAGPLARELIERVFSSAQPIPPREWTRDVGGEERTWMVGLYPIAAAGKPDEVELGGMVALDVSPFAQTVADLHSRADELTENERRKDVFLAVLSHELRNPLAALRNATDLLVL